MAISRIGSGTAQATSITIPGTYAAGDLIVIAASRSTNATPTIPSGWVTLSAAGSSGIFLAVVCRFAQSASEPAPTFTNANLLNCAVYRASAGVLLPSPAIAANGGTSATINYAAISNYRSGVLANWYVASVAQATTANALETAPSGMTNVNLDSVTGLEAAMHDTNGDQLSNWASANVVLANSAVYRSAVIQIFEMEYTFPSGGGGIFFRPGMSGGMSE
jgi:hypothetical protein